MISDTSKVVTHDVAYYKMFFSWVQHPDFTLSRYASATRLHTVHHQTFLPDQTVHHADQ